ncbi:heme-binding protein [Haloferax sp. MBLA0076]|uniref:Heme-binding protein n=1 Tax=Haloferax litoreum TaxID=2666140 RepID=A0A6A8GMH5_9EURY|nr:MULTISPECIES: heme-binding protein [Haloferax]KAB1194358.1 heme-binding protein [Haloferax sp. CBA1148]MRX22920.1 heme-binding protein [Haloferax litoreum]
MKRRTKFVLAGLGLALGATALSRATRSTDTETVPYTVVESVDDVEIRHYPTTVTVETTARNTGVAFQRLFRYISGANQRREEVSMTAPVATELVGPESGTKIPMTAPVATDRTDSGVQMAFFLPSSYEYDSAPRPTDPDVELVEHPARTLAVRQFSWYATGRRTRREVDSLLDTLAETGIAVVGKPFLMQYDPPSTLPFFRTNEVAVEVQRRERGQETA